MTEAPLVCPAVSFVQQPQVLPQTVVPAAAAEVVPKYADFSA